MNNFYSIRKRLCLNCRNIKSYKIDIYKKQKYCSHFAKFPFIYIPIYGSIICGNFIVYVFKTRKFYCFEKIDLPTLKFKVTVCEV